MPKAQLLSTMLVRDKPSLLLPLWRRRRLALAFTFPLFLPGLEEIRTTLFLSIPSRCRNYGGLPNSKSQAFKCPTIQKKNQRESAVLVKEFWILKSIVVEIHTTSETQEEKMRIARLTLLLPPSAIQSGKRRREKKEEEEEEGENTLFPQLNCL